MSLFLPKDDKFFLLFREMQQDVEAMSALFSAFVSDFTSFDGYIEKAHAIEKHADQIAHQIVAELNTSFITPLDREDIHKLAHELDEIIDRIEDIIRNVHLYHFTHRVDSMVAFADCIQRATTHLGVMMGHLEKRKYTPALTEEKIKIHEIEDEADVLFETAISYLFEQCTDPIEIIKTKDILEEMEMVVDTYQQVSNMIESVIIKVN